VEDGKRRRLPSVTWHHAAALTRQTRAATVRLAGRVDLKAMGRAVVPVPRERHSLIVSARAPRH
jgi:hypothetical protein